MHTFLKEAKRKKNGGPSPGFTNWPANGIFCLVLRAFWSIVFQQRRAYWDTSRFQVVWETFSTINRGEKERFIGHWLPKKWGKTCKSIFSLETFFGRFSGTLPRNVSIQNPPPPPKKNDFFSDWVGLFEICFRSSKMTDPRPCPTGWTYLELYRVQRRHAKLKSTTNYQLQTSMFLRGQRNITWQNTCFPNVYMTFFGKNWFVWRFP